MSKCKEIVCDLCGEHLKDSDCALFVRAKRKWYLWHESGYNRELICVCAECQRGLRKIIRDRRGDNG